MDYSAVYGSGTTLKSEDIKGKEPTVTIEDIQVKEFDGDKGKTKKLVLSFVGREKVFVCNKTNANIIAEMYGADTDEWIGKKITLYVARVEYAGKIVDGIRVKLVASAPAQRRPAPARDDEMEQDIPF